MKLNDAKLSTVKFFMIPILACVLQPVWFMLQAKLNWHQNDFHDTLINGDVIRNQFVSQLTVFALGFLFLALPVLNWLEKLGKWSYANWLIVWTLSSAPAYLAYRTKSLYVFDAGLANTVFFGSIILIPTWFWWVVYAPVTQE